MARFASIQRATAVFSPEKEKSYAASRGPVRPRGKAMASGSPSRASRSMTGPPGKPSCSTRAILSKASPAASSMVAPSGRTSEVMSEESSSEEWPPLTSRAIVGSGSRPCSSWSTQMCEARWLTP